MTTCSRCIGGLIEGRASPGCWCVGVCPTVARFVLLCRPGVMKPSSLHGTDACSAMQTYRLSTSRSLEPARTSRRVTEDTALATPRRTRHRPDHVRRYRLSGSHEETTDDPAVPLLPAQTLARVPSPDRWSSPPATAITSTSPASSSCAPPCPGPQQALDGTFEMPEACARSPSGKPPPRIDDVLEVSMCDQPASAPPRSRSPAEIRRATDRRPHRHRRHDLRARRPCHLHQAGDRARDARRAGSRRRRQAGRSRGVSG